MSFSCPSSPLPMKRTINRPYSYDSAYRYRGDRAYLYTNLSFPDHDSCVRDPYAHMESFIPTISAESLPWCQFYEEKLARFPRGRRVAKHLRRAAQAVRGCLIYVRLPSQVHAPFPKRRSTCEIQPGGSPKQRRII